MMIYGAVSCVCYAILPIIAILEYTTSSYKGILDIIQSTEFWW